MKKVITFMAMIMVLMITSAFAVDDNTTVVDTNSTIDAGSVTPDNTFLYRFQRLGEWASLNWAKLGGEEKYLAKENEILQEKLAELKVIKEENREQFQLEIEEKIQDRKERQEENIEELKAQIEERKQELLQNNVTSVVDDEVIAEIEEHIAEIEGNLQSDDDNIRKRLKSVTQAREEVKEQKQEQYETEEFQAREMNRNVNKYMEENSDVLSEYSDVLSEFEGKTFYIETDKRNMSFEVLDNNIEFFVFDGQDVDYTIIISDEDKVTEMIEDGIVDIDAYNDLIDMPLSLKTKLVYIFLTYEDSEVEE